MSATLKEYPVDQVVVHPDRCSGPFWEAAAERRLVVSRCSQCGRYRFPPTELCSNCRSDQVDWVEVSGNGSLYTYTIIAGGVAPSLRDHLPYAVVAVALDDAPVRILGNFIGGTVDELEIGLPVSVNWGSSDKVTVPRFEKRK